jgi:hypothetical protein
MYWGSQGREALSWDGEVITHRYCFEISTVSVAEIRAVAPGSVKALGW